MTEPLRILQILRAHVGGLSRHVQDLTRELAARGLQLGIVADSLHTDALSEERLDRLRPFAPLGIHSLPIAGNRRRGAPRPAAQPVPLAR